MISHELKIGQRIWDSLDERWGTILLIGGEEKGCDISNEETDLIVTYKPDDSDGECEVMADFAYPIVEGRFFWGEDVCLEIHKDSFDCDHDWDFFCPERDENCFDFEVTERDMNTNFRTYRDTQIYKEGGKPTSEEWSIIKDKLLNKDGYKYYDDEANGYFAISISEVWQKENDAWGNNLVDALNNLEENKDKFPWYLGDENEEYVFVN